MLSRLACVNSAKISTGKGIVAMIMGQYLVGDAKN